MASAISSILGTPTSAGPASTASKSSPAPSEEVFLQLLVSQIKNQDPLNPSDSTQFVTQLAQFSQLEQVIGIRNDIENSMNTGTPVPAPSAGAPTTPTNPSNSTTSSN